MYTIKRKGKKVPKVLKNTFNSYDEARNAVRKWLRSNTLKDTSARDWIDVINRTVTISFYGFSISKVG